MNKIIIYLGVFLTGLVIQFSFTQFISIGGLSPDFLLIFVIFIGLIYGPLEAQLYGFAWGLTWDIFGVEMFGSHAFLFTCVGYVAGQLAGKWNESKISAQILLVAVASIFYILGKYLLYQIFSPGEFVFRLNYITILQPFLNVIVAPLIFVFCLRLTDFIDDFVNGSGRLDRF